MTVTTSAGPHGATAPADPPPVTALVLSDGTPTLAQQSVASLKGIVAHALVLERRPSGADAPDALACDWEDLQAIAAVLSALSTPWLLVLAAGERLVAPDPSALAGEVRDLPLGPVELLVGGVREVRLHPATPDAVAAIGGHAEAHLSSVRLDPPRSASIPDQPSHPTETDDGEPFIGGEVITVGAPLRKSPEQSSLPAGLSEQEQARERLQALEEQRMLQVVRRGRDVCWLEDEQDDEPLVTIRIATYNRGQLVVDRAITSALNQTYRNIEVLVVGDACDEETEQAVRSVEDPRVRFVNLPHRGIYPEDPMSRWMVAGAAPMNAALYLARGAWLAPCDDDDELTPDHVEVLLAHAKRHRLEMVYSRARCEVTPGVWQEIGSEPLAHGYISHGSVMYSLGLRFLEHNPAAWKLPEPGDWNLWRRMRDAGVRIGFADHLTYVHYLEGYKRDAMPQSPAATAQRLHLGCGPNKLVGWVNIDVEEEYEPDLLHDLTSGIPAADDSAEVIYSEHVFEHFSLEAGTALLAEALRVLRPGGVLRIAMPDLAHVIERYQNGWRDQPWLQEPGFAYIDTACRMLNVGLREWGHTYVYDEEDICLRLHQAGFTSIRRCGLGESEHAELRGLETRADSLLIVEAVAP